MKSTGILLILIGIIGILLGSMMFGDIGIAAIIGSVVGIFSGIGFIQTGRAIKALEKDCQQ